MKPYQKLLLKMFFFITVIELSLFWFFDYIRFKNFSFANVAFFIVLFTVFLIFVFVIPELKRMSSGNMASLTEEDLKVRQYKKIKTTVSIDEFIELLKQSNYFFKSKVVKVKDNKVTIKTSMTLNSFGEIITVEFSNQSDNTYSVEILSKPKFIVLLFDCGINKKNVEEVCKLLSNKS